jgi:hypothetical protein
MSRFLLLVALSGFLAASCAGLAKRQPETECSLHHVPLEKNIVKLSYGRPVQPSAEYEKAKSAEFPYSYLSAWGGCGVKPFIRRARVKACALCDAAERKWLETHVKYGPRDHEGQAELVGVGG